MALAEALWSTHLFRVKKLITLIITVALLGFIWAKIDRAALLANLKATRWPWFGLAIGMFVPQIWVAAWRWKQLVIRFTPLTTGEGVRMILASLTMNLVLPSKMGDLSKGYFLYRTSSLDLKRSMNIVVFEKMLDVATLALMMLLGVVFLLGRGGSGQHVHAALIAGGIGLMAIFGFCILYFVPIDALGGRRLLLALESQPKLAKVRDLIVASHDVISLLQSRGARRGMIIASSLTLWLLHLGQIYCFFLAMNAPAPIMQFMSLVPLAIFIGLVPLTIAGFGTRDAALIYFFPQFPNAVMLGVALYVNLRYILPAVVGIPFLNRYIAYARELRSQREDQKASSTN